jgi:hypothetical protein
LVRTGSLDKIMVHLDGIKAVKVVHSLGQQIEKNERFGLECCWRVKICKNMFLFYEYCNVNLYMFSAWCGALRKMNNFRVGGM